VNKKLQDLARRGLKRDKDSFQSMHGVFQYGNYQKWRTFLSWSKLVIYLDTPSLGKQQRLLLSDSLCHNCPVEYPSQMCKLRKMIAMYLEPSRRLFAINQVEGEM
jgi:hypothetical protein